MANYNATSTINLVVNGTQAKKILQDTQKRADELRKKIEAAAKAGDKASMQKFNKELRSCERVIAQMTTETTSVANTLSRLDKATPKELNKALSVLRKELNGIERGSAAWDAQVEKIRKVKAELDKVNASTRAQQSAWQRINGVINQYQTAIMGAAAAMTGLIMAGRKAVNTYAEMEEQLANTRKYTGLSTEATNELNEAFKRMDTRTPREKLNELAQEAGRLGKNTIESVQGYVEAADIINVALVDLGEGATQTIAKLTNIFGVEQMLGTKDAMLAVGSTVNVLSQNCTASKPYLVEFAQRMAGIGSQAGLTIPQILAFGAVLDANGQKVEMSATAIQKVIMNLANKNHEFANILGLDAKKLNETLKNSAKDGLLMFLEALQKMGQSVGFDNATMSLAPAFKDMGLDAARVSQVLSTLAMHLDEVKWQIGEADKAFEQASSATHEYEIFNTTAQAAIDKAKKRVTELSVELGEKLYPIMKHIYTSSGIFLRVLNTMVDFFIKYKEVIAGTAIAFITYKTALIAVTAAEKIEIGISQLSTKFTQIKTAAVNLYHVAMGTATIAMKKAVIAQRELNMAMSKNLWGVLMLAIGAAFGALINYVNKINETRQKEKELAEERKKFQKEAQDISSQSNDMCAKEITQLKSLYSAAIDESLAKEERIKSAKKLIALYPDQFGNMSAEQIMLGQAKSAYDDLTESIINNARAKAAAEKVLENEKKLLDLREELKQERKAYKEADKEVKDAKAESVHRQVAPGSKAGIASAMAASASENGGATFEYSRSQQAIKAAVTKRNEAATAINSKKADIKVLEDANKSLSKQYSNNDAFKEQMGVSDNNSTASEDSTPLVRNISETEKKKLDAEAKRAAAKAKKEFKDALKSIEGERDEALTENLTKRAVGEIDYREFQEQKYEIEDKYYEDSLKLFESHNLEEDADYAELLKKRAEHNQKYNEQRLALDKDAIQRTAAVEERETRARFESKKNKTLADELQLQEEILKIKYNALLDEQSLYDAGSKEYLDIQRKIEDLLWNDRQDKQKKVTEAKKKFESEFNKLSAKEKFDLDMKVLEELYKNHYILEADYQKWKAALEKSYRTSAKEESQKMPGAKPTTAKSKAKDAKEKFNDQKQELDKALKEGIIDDKEYSVRLARIKAEMNSALIDPLKSAQSEWLQMLTTAYDAWSEFAESIKDPDADPLEAFSKGMQATAGVVTGVIQQVTAFQQAEYQIQSKAVEKRYDDEIAKAEGNSTLQKKLEAEKQEELDKLKAEQSKKNFALQVIATIAQTAANAVQAYSAGLSIGGPAGLVMGPVAAALAVAQGAVQIALLKKQQQAAAAMGYSQGGFTRPGRVDEPAGVVHAGEWVASQKLVNSPNTRPMIEMLEYAQRNNTIGSISMADVSRSVAAPMINAYASQHQAPIVIQQPEPSRQMPDSGLSDTISRLNKRLEQPFITVNSVTGEYGMREANRKYERLMQNKSRRNRS